MLYFHEPYHAITYSKGRTDSLDLVHVARDFAIVLMIEEFPFFGQF